MLYHLLDEPFSAYTGLANSSSVANLMRFDESSVVICQQADDTWGFDEQRIFVIPQLGVLTAEWKGRNMRGWRFVPFGVRRRIVCDVFGAFLDQLGNEDVVFCHNWPYVAEALESAVHSRGANLIYHAQNSLAPYAAICLFKSSPPDALVFNSDAMRQEALKLMPYLKNTYVIHNGADERLFYPRPSPATRNRSVPVILYVGRLVSAKGVHVLMEAMTILHESDIAAICRVVGSSHAGGHRNKSTPYIKSLYKCRPPNVQLEGFRSAMNIAEEYRSADILCCPSIWQEPFGNVNIEAMACGIPVVASRVGGIPEIASEGGVVLVEPGSAGDLANALRRLILDKGLRARVGAEGLTSFKRRFTWGAIVKKYQQLFQSLEESTLRACCVNVPDSV